MMSNVELARARFALKTISDERGVSVDALPAADVAAALQEVLQRAPTLADLSKVLDSAIDKAEAIALSTDPTRTGANEQTPVTDTRPTGAGWVAVQAADK